MALKGFFKKRIQKNIKIARWIGYTQYQAMVRFFLALIQSRWVFPQTGLKAGASFEEMVQRFNLSEADLRQRQKQFQRLVGLWLAFFVLACAYGMYLAVLGAWLSVASIVVLSAIILCQAFQYHFWAFQIMQRRLNCTLAEWWQVTFQKE